MSQYGDIKSTVTKLVHKENYMMKSLHICLYVHNKNDMQYTVKNARS